MSWLSNLPVFKIRIENWLFKELKIEVIMSIEAIALIMKNYLLKIHHLLIVYENTCYFCHTTGNPYNSKLTHLFLKLPGKDLNLLDFTGTRCLILFCILTFNMNLNHCDII